MIGFLRGTVAGCDEKLLLMDVGGVGYEVNIPLGMASELPPIGEEIKVYTYLSVKDDGFSLFGFLKRDDLEMFKMLLAVSGIGPKAGQSILSTLSADDLRFAILSGDSKAIAKAPGVGAKTAQRVIIDLKDKLSFEESFEKAFNESEGKKAAGESDSIARDETVEALVALGYSATDAYKAVRAADDGSGMDSGALLKASLKYI